MAEGDPRPSMTDPLVENDGETVSVSIYPPDGYVFDEVDDSGDEPTIYFRRATDDE